MGGIVARLAADETRVETIITMSTPHTIPPLPLDYDMEQVYRRADNGLPFTSLCGGASDTQIISDSCAAGDTVFTSSLAGVWTGVDHQAMVWCHQVRAHLIPRLLRLERWDQASKRTTLRVEAASTAICADPKRPSSDWDAIPAPRQQPFPLPGQGIQENEIAWTRDLVPGLHEVLCDGALSIQPINTLRVPPASSLLVHRLSLSTTCTAPPLIQSRTKCANLTETRFGYAPFFTHNHIAQAPFLPRDCESEINILADCNVTAMALNVDWRHSLVQIFQRYRTAAVTWPVGWYALQIAHGRSNKIALMQDRHFPPLPC